MISLFNKNRLSILLSIAFFVTAVVFPYQISASEITNTSIDSEEFVNDAGMIEGENNDLFTVDSISVNAISINSLSSNFTKPYAFLTKKKIVLNGTEDSVSDDTYLVMNVDGDYEVTGIASSNNIGVYINKVSYNELPAFRIGIEAGTKTEKGTYKYDICLKDRRSGAQVNKLKFRATVKKSVPSFKWKKQTVELGTASKNFALNSPVAEGVSIVPVNSTKYKAKIPEGIIIKLQNENTVKITADSKKLKLNKNYTVQLYLMYANGESLKVKKQSFKVRITDKGPAVNLKKTGGNMDLSARCGGSVNYRLTVRNSGMVINDIWIDGTASGNYVLDKKSDPFTGEITDICISARNDAALTKSTAELNFGAVLKDAGMDTKEVHTKSSVKTPIRSSRLKLAFVSGNQLKFNETLSDNLIAGTIELRVNSPLYAKIDTDSILDLTYDKGKVPKDAFKSYWTVDEYGQAARIRVVADKSKVVSGKKYTLTYSLMAKGADKNTAPTRINVKAKIS